MDAAAGPVRSALYPNDWQPGRKDAQGRFLHDFSYAGYRNGEQPFPALVGRKRIDVVTDFAADRTGASDATRALQAALDAATPGSEVFIPSGQYRIDGLLKLTTSGVALRGEGAAKSVLRFTKTAAMTDSDHLTIGGALRSATLLPLLSLFWRHVVRNVEPRHQAGRLKQWLNYLRRVHPEAEVAYRTIRSITDPLRIAAALFPGIEPPSLPFGDGRDPQAVNLGQIEAEVLA